jgi:hypothetical protein
MGNNEVAMNPVVVIAAIAVAWFVLSVLAALWLAYLLGGGDPDNDFTDRPALTGEPVERPRAIPRV